MADLIEIYVHWFAGRSKSEIAASLGVDRGTLRKYLAPAEAAGIRPGGPPALVEADWRRLVAEWFPQVVDPRCGPRRGRRSLSTATTSWGS